MCGFMAAGNAGIATKSERWGIDMKERKCSKPRSEMIERLFRAVDKVRPDTIHHTERQIKTKSCLIGMLWAYWQENREFAYPEYKS
jgi:hypothetical protein